VAEEDEADRQPGSPTGSAKVPDNSLSRLLALSDGVFAIAMTLLALDLQVPPNLGNHVTSQQLIHALGQHTASYWSFILSFYVIATYWSAHRRLLRSVTAISAALIRYTTFLLLIVAAMPFPTSLLGQYGSTPFALALYGAINVLAQAALIALTYEVRRSDLSGRGVVTREDKRNLLTGWLNLGVFLLCIPAGYLFGHNGPFILLLLVPTNRLDRLHNLTRRDRPDARWTLPRRRRGR
jgi:uncharacterized membrane protein